MAISINKVMLVGRLGADPEIKGQDSQFVKLRVATSESWRDKHSGERQERTQWHTVVVFNDATARFLTTYAKKGDLVSVEGMLETRKWEAPDGDKYFTEVVVRQFGGNVQLMSKSGREPGETEDDEPRPATTRRVAEKPASKPQTTSRNHDLDDEIPF